MKEGEQEDIEDKGKKKTKKEKKITKVLGDRLN